MGHSSISVLDEGFLSNTGAAPCGELAVLSFDSIFSVGIQFSPSKLRNIYQIQPLLLQKNAKEDEIGKEIAKNDTEMVCDGGDPGNE